MESNRWLFSISIQINELVLEVSIVANGKKNQHV